MNVDTVPRPDVGVNVARVVRPQVASRYSAPPGRLRRRWRRVLVVLGLSRFRYWPPTLSAVAHLVILLLLAFFTVRSNSHVGAVRVPVLMDTSLGPPENVFESNAWVVDDTPMLRDPGGGPLRAANLTPSEDSALSADSEKALAGLTAAALDPGDFFSDGSKSKEGGGESFAEGVGGGSGAGVGSADFFGFSAKGNRIVYVIDRSNSMAANFSFEQAINELHRSLEKLTPAMRFQVIFYNEFAEIIDLPGKGMVLATKSNLDRAYDEIRRVNFQGGTNHEKALVKAVSMRPDVIFLLTDAEDADPKMIRSITRLNRSRRRGGKAATIHVIHFHHAPERFLNKTIRSLASQNKGTYKLIDTNELGRPLMGP